MESPTPPSTCPPAPNPAEPAKPPAAPQRFLPEETADALAEKLKQFPDDMALALAWQDALDREGRRPEAEQDAAARWQANGKDPMALLLQGRIRGGDEGRIMVEDARKARPSSPEVAQVLAEIEERAGKWDDAKKALDLLVGLRGSARDWMWAGYVRWEADDNAGAIEAYDKALSGDPTLVAPRVAKALILNEDDKPADALKLLESDANPALRSALWHLTLALVRQAAGKPEVARASLEQAIDLAAGNRRLLLAGVARGVDIQAWALCKSALDAALQRWPNDPDFLAGKAIVALEQKKDGDAVAALTDATKAVQNDGRLFFLLGVSETRMNHMDKALAAFKKAMALEPKNGRYALGVAHALDRRGSKDALDAYQHAWETDPTAAEPHVAAALLLNAKGDVDGAEGNLLAARKLAPNEPDVLYYLAIIHGDRQGYLGKALEDLREYKKIGGAEPEALDWLQALEAEQSK